MAVAHTRFTGQHLFFFFFYWAIKKNEILPLGNALICLQGLSLRADTSKCNGMGITTQLRRERRGLEKRFMYLGDATQRPIDVYLG